MDQVKILISGANGKMGHAVAAAISGREDCVACCGVDLYTQQYGDFPIYEKLADVPEKPDVIIDFSNPALLDDLLDYCLTNGVPCVFATTGYSAEQIAKIKQAAASIPVFFSFNMSLGINLLAQLAKKAVSILGGQFDIEIVEKHHNKKLDAPSGTALMIADALAETVEYDAEYTYERQSKRAARAKNEIGISSVRGGTIVGEHEVMFCGADEIITVSHSAASRDVFARGALRAAAYIKGKPAGFYDMSTMIAGE